MALLAPVAAQADAPENDAESAPLMDLFDRFMRGFMEDIEPQLRELERGFSALEPEMERLLDQMRDMTQYHPPEVLPNGDILIRRRTEKAAPDDAPEPQDEDDAEVAEDPFEL